MPAAITVPPAQTAETLVRTKLFIPPLRAEHVSRPRLVARLEAALSRPVTLVSAPAGFGKTTLLTQWLDQQAEARPRDPSPLGFLWQPAQAAWLSLDERDNDPARFTTYLVAALQTLEYRIDVRPPEAGGLEPLLTDLINVLADLPDDFVLVLDDYHTLTHPAINAALSALIQRMPVQMHLVLATRADPPDLPLAQLRARGQLLEVRAADLRFTAEEAAAFLEGTLGLRLAEPDIAALTASTEGWAAGLQLAALASGAAGRATPPADFNGGHHYVADYLAEQVLRQQPAEIQRFLLGTAILEQLSGPLCEAVLDEGQASPAPDPAEARPARRPAAVILEELEHANLFLEALDAERHWYRYHGLFAEFLRARLRQTEPQRPAELHRRAARWLEAHGWLPEAVGHALASGDAEQAARLVEQMAETFWRQGEMMRLLGWLEALPDDLIRRRPRLSIFHAWILNILGQPEAVERRLAEAEAALAQAPEAPETRTLSGMLAATRGIIALMSGAAADALALASQAERDLSADNFVWRGVVARNIGNAHWLQGAATGAGQAFRDAFSLSQAADNVYMSLVSLYELGELHLVQGQLQRAADVFRQGLALAQARATPGMTMPGALHAGLSAVLYDWDELAEARQHALTAVALGEQGRSLGVRVCAYTRLSLIERARGDEAAARTAFEAAARLAPAAVRRRTSFLAHHDVQAVLWGRLGGAGPAASFFAAHALRPETPPDGMNEAGLLALARWLVEAQRPAEARDLLQRLGGPAEAAGRFGRLGEIKVLEARAELALGQAAAAGAALARALNLAQPENRRRLFLDEGSGVRDLLSRVTGRPRAFAGQLLAGFPRREHAAGEADALSERELDVLRLIAAGLSTQAIAQQLVVAPSTIQTHLKHLYSKLDVHSRTQAVARARALRLLE